ncbi:hypothetical protein OsI_08177 [Oryza sativa Indica Group]|uniref:Uncharacterized protein n=1 Tax=Oryza sativa subsp. indica TaxID=39946 RepID=B8AFS2_ORYSI|nr:hypothetical protein OsI_08177 [Oryza sativa Indica Group]
MPTLDYYRAPPPMYYTPPSPPHTTVRRRRTEATTRCRRGGSHPRRRRAAVASTIAPSHCRIDPTAADVASIPPQLSSHRSCRSRRHIDPATATGHRRIHPAAAAVASTTTAAVASTPAAVAAAVASRTFDACPRCRVRGEQRKRCVRDVEENAKLHNYPPTMVPHLLIPVVPRSTEAVPAVRCG